MDIKIKTDEKVFNYCARAIIKQDEKFLLICVNDAPYYHLPGGHVEIGENSKDAVLREIKEEVGIDVALGDLVLINEQFYDKQGVATHSMILYYVAKPKAKIDTQNLVRMEKMGTKLIKNELRWVTLDELKTIDLRPQLIKDLIVNNSLDTLRHIIG